eukprot:CAMPEP_0119132324 /NCGR_PEP_ID=MMETSP1310-20130426/11776_1 /TAXON_ID=464262 /ORGANISM="Genus nov. species nov., Strain RCC2339" /LENGTH=1076 /DNA_ID=CAMNT_0007122951 /DNA_START=6 /DNA_END=3236 /DNA_ORIENTATION=-
MADTGVLQEVPERLNFPKAEEEILAYWKKIEAFENSGRRHEGLPEYSFYDGPPFATGTPHYGHILAGTIKDTVTRYAHMNGNHVVRRFGWDTHGLPIEFEIDKLLGVRTRDQVLEMGIDKYNEECRKIVMRYSEEWRATVTRLGRWIDFDNDYKTMNKTYMESVWWVFSQLFEKDYVYRGFKVMPYSYPIATPMSNFEAGSNYQNKADPYIFVTFPLVEDPETELVAMTTTPWTLPSNLSLCVNPEMDYVKVCDKETGRKLVLLKSRLSELYKNLEDGKLFTIVETFKGAALKGKQYQPIFDYFEKMSESGAFRVLTDSYVKDDAGTGVVHQAPAFGLDDFRVCEANGIIEKGGYLPLPLDANCRFTKEVPDYEGQLVFDANKPIQANLKARKRLWKALVKSHSYPYCWRSDTPLIYRGVPCWFIRVEKIRDRLLKNQEETYWVPKAVSKRFENWLANAIDWAVSRNRFWGCPLPLWANEDFSEIKCIESVEMLEKLSGKKVDDLHREHVDDITIPSKDGKGVLRRVEEVFDCWFESGSMPYAQLHYPFENKELFEKSFPADFIAEGLDQTRGWFYTLMVLSTIVFDKPAFKNLIVNGMVLAEDGEKMSKRKKNYPDPNHVIDKYGADALRLYLINSPVVRADELRFTEKGVKDVQKDVLLPWYHAYRFVVEHARTHEGFQADVSRCKNAPNVMDQWVLAVVQNLVSFVRKEMEAYRLYTVVPELVRFIEQLTNVYIKLNRSRFRQCAPDDAAGLEDQYNALNTSVEVLLTVCVLMAPCTPFLAEHMYFNLRALLPPEKKAGPLEDFRVCSDSVHYLPLPKPQEDLFDAEVVEAVSILNDAIDLGRKIRERNTLPLKQPLSKMIVFLKSEEDLKLLDRVKGYIKEELKLKDVILSTDGDKVEATLKPNGKVLGKRLRGDLKKVVAAIKKMTAEEISDFIANGGADIAGHHIDLSEVYTSYSYKGTEKNMESDASHRVVCVLDTLVTEELHEEFLMNQVINLVQRMRKDCGVKPTDHIRVYYTVAEKYAAQLVHAEAKIGAAIAKPFAKLADKPEDANVISDKTHKSVCNVRLVITT